MAIFLLSFLLLLSLLDPKPCFALPPDPDSDFSVLTWHDYSPPSPLPPPPSPTLAYASCETDLGGSGDFDTLCEVLSSKSLSSHIYIKGNGSLVLVGGVSLTCPKAGCEFVANLSGYIKIGAKSKIVAGRVVLASTYIYLSEDSVVNTTALGGDPPARTSGVPTGTHGDGGGYGGRGASCYIKDGQTQEDSWGGDPYDWVSLEKPDSYGSQGGSTSVEFEYGGGGGGRVWIVAKEVLKLEGMVLADGGDGGDKGGGGSGGSIYIFADKMKGSGNISASGGNGLAGGGGGHVSVDVFSRHDDTFVFVHGGWSSGCPDNAGAAGTLYKSIPKSLIVDNNNYSTQTDTLLMEFPHKPLWTNVFVKNCAKAAIPLLWSRIQLQGQLSILSGAALTFGLAQFPYAEFELLAEELLMSDSTVKVFGGFRVSVKMLLMWNARMIIDGGDDSTFATSLLEASNLIALKEASVIHSNANLGIHGQGLFNLSGNGDTIEAQSLILSHFYIIQVGPGSVLRGPTINGTKDHMAPKLNCESETCPAELIHPEDCNVDTSLSSTLQICRVEGIYVWGLIEGTVVHFHRTGSITLYPSGIISANGHEEKGPRPKKSKEMISKANRSKM